MMGRIKRQESKKPLKKTAIYVIVFSDNKTCFIGKCQADNIRNNYKYHYILRNDKTKAVFEKEKQDGTLPQIYLLQTVVVPAKRIQPYCIAWAKYFMDHGYSLLEGQALLGSYTIDMRGLAEQTYSEIKDLPLDEFCSPEKSLFPNYGARNRPDYKKKTHSDKVGISITVSKRQYDKIVSEARKNGLTVAEYCRQRVFNGKIINVNTDCMTDLLRILEDDNQLLDQVLYSMYIRGETAPADLKNMERITDHIFESTDVALKKFQEEIELLRKTSADKHE